MKKIIFLMLIVVLVSCRKKIVNEKNIANNFQSNEIIEIESYLGEFYNTNKINQSDNLNKNNLNSVITEVSLKYDLWLKKTNNNNIVLFDNVMYDKNISYKYEVIKFFDKEVFFTGNLYNEDEVVFSTTSNLLGELFVKLDEYYSGFLANQTEIIFEKDFSKYGVDIFPVGEELDSNSILYSDEKRGFNVNELLSVKEVEKDGVKYFRVYNPLPYVFKDVYIIGEVGGVEVIFYFIKELKEFSELLYPFETIMNKRKFNKTDGEVIGIEDLVVESFYITTDDDMFEKLKKIKATNRIKFQYRVEGMYIQVKNEEARKYMPIIANIYYTISTEEFREELMKDTTYITKNDRTIMTTAEKEAVYNVYLSKNIYLRLCTPNAEGVADLPGNGFGLARHKFIQFYPRNDGTIDTRGVVTWAHELGHNLGFSHSSNMTYSNDVGEDGVRDGATIVWGKIYRELMEKKELPFLTYPFDSDINIVKS